MLQDISIFLLDVLTGLILVVILLRFFLQLARANFRNPLAQAIVQLTSPLIVPVRRVVPPLGTLDTATLLVAYAAQVALLAVMQLLLGIGLPANILVLAVFELARLSLNIFFFAILIGVVLSWVAPGTYNPAAALIDDLTRPILRPVRRWVPPIAGLDLSPLAATLLIGIASIVLTHLQRMAM